jgi:hypothetical protein
VQWKNKILLCQVVKYGSGLARLWIYSLTFLRRLLKFQSSFQALDALVDDWLAAEPFESESDSHCGKRKTKGTNLH